MAGEIRQREGVPITREMMGVAKGPSGRFVTRAIVPGHRDGQADTFALAASPPRDVEDRVTHTGYELAELVLRCWAVGIPVWGADVEFEGRIGRPEYGYMRKDRGTHEFEHVGTGALAACVGHAGAPCGATARSLGDGARRWRHDGESGPAEADIASLARERLNEVTEYLRHRGQSEASIRVTPSIVQIKTLLDGLPEPSLESEPNRDGRSAKPKRRRRRSRSRAITRTQRRRWAPDPLDPDDAAERAERGRVLRERASASHETALQQIAAWLGERGFAVSEADYDILAKRDDLWLLIEVKSVTTKNLRRQAMTALGQLAFYRYDVIEDVPKDVELLNLVAFDQPVGDPYVEGVLKHWGAFVTWVDATKYVMADPELADRINRRPS